MAANSTSESLPVNFDSTIGALLIGFAVSAVLVGVLGMQCYTYFRRYPSDKHMYKWLVVAIWILEIVDQIFIGHSVYYYTVVNYINPNALFLYKPIWSLILQMTAGALVGTVIKACFAIRVWRFSYRNWILTIFLFALTFGQFALAIAYTIKCFYLSYLPQLVNLRVIGTLTLSLGVATDMSIAAALCYYLQGMRNGLSKSDTLVVRLMIYAINTGVVTSACSLATVILYNVTPNNFIFMCFYFVLSKLYAISFLATLNTRQIIRGRGTDGEHRSTSFYMVTDAINPDKSIRMPEISGEARSKSQMYSADSTTSPSTVRVNVDYDVCVS